MKKISLLPIAFLLILSACSTPPPENKSTSLGVAPATFMNGNSSEFIPIVENQNSSTSNTNGSDNNANGNPDETTNQNGNGSSNSNETTVLATPSSIDPVLLNPHETAFDCKTLSVYETMDFYSKFLAKLESLPRYSTHDIKILSGQATTDPTALNKKLNGREDRGFITSACLAKDQSIFVAVIKGDDGSNLGFKLVRYILARDVVEVAGREDERNATHWKFFPSTFGKRTGNSLSLNATGREGETRISMIYAYNYVTNDLRVAEYCKQVGSGKKECAGYPY